MTNEVIYDIVQATSRSALVDGVQLRLNAGWKLGGLTVVPNFSFIGGIITQNPAPQDQVNILLQENNLLFFQAVYKEAENATTP